MSRVRALVLSLLTLIPLVLAGVYVGVGGLDPARTWTSDSAEAPSGAPADALTAVDLVDARRAAGEASSQAGFLTAGTQELVDGTAALREGADQLSAGAATASTGAQELADGMIQLQAGTANLGVGATEVADAVGTTVDAVIGVNVVRGQAVGAIDRTLAELAGNDDPDVVAVREELAGLRDQLGGMEVATNDMERLRDGSREIANQLTTPGFAFHDGIYSATNGASNLNMGLNDLETGLTSAVDGVVALDDGAQRVDDMADQTKARVDNVNRAMPVVWPGAAEDAGEGALHSVSPIVAMLVAALAMLVGVGLGIAVRLWPQRRWVTLLGGTFGAVVGGLVALMVLTSGLSATSVWISALALALGVLATAGVTVLLTRLAGVGLGSALAGVLAIAQVGVVGWVWRKASTAEVAEWAQAVSGLMPLHWNTATLTAAGNQGDATQMWLGLAVLAVIAVPGLIAVATGPKQAPA
ncbi:hypothetical protein CGUA_01065 [Corynebacterium guangdongense]|nr:hypothetical protein CGUA_01065 [Corynebacterium guangdongense]